MAIQLGDAVLNITGDPSELQKGFGKLQKVIGAAMTAAGAAITGFAALSIKTAAETEVVNTRLATVLKSTGEAAGLTFDELTKMATGLQDVTTFGDEAVKETQALLLTFTKIGKDVFPQALETVLDMSVALGQDTKQGAIQLGKALNDPILGVTALQRVGVQFTESQKEQIEVLVKSGKTMEAQKVILAELTTQFGGQARAEAETFSGQIKQLRNDFGDLLEAIGENLLPFLKDTFVPFVREVIQTITGWIEANPELARTIIVITAAIGGLLLILGPLLILMPGIVATMSLFAGPAGVAGATTALAGAAGGGGLVAAFGAAVVAAAPFLIAIAALGFATHKLLIAFGDLKEAEDELALSEALLAAKRQELLLRTGETEAQANARSNAIADDAVARTKRILAAELGRAATTAEIIERMRKDEDALAASQEKTAEAATKAASIFVQAKKKEAAAARVRIGEIVINGETIVATISKERFAANEAFREEIGVWKKEQGERKKRVASVQKALATMTDANKEATGDIGDAWDKLSDDVKKSMFDMADGSVKGTEVVGKSWDDLTPQVQADAQRIAEAMRKTSPFAEESPSLVAQTLEGLNIMASAWTAFADGLNNLLSGLIAKIKQLNPFAKSSPSLVEDSASGLNEIARQWTRNADTIIGALERIRAARDALAGGARGMGAMTRAQQAFGSAAPAAQSGGGSFTLNVDMRGSVVREAADIERLSQRIMQHVNRSLSRTGSQLGLAVSG